MQRELRATSLVQELTAIVKEQKGRLGELANSRGEAERRERERAREVEEEVASRSKLEVQLQTLQEVHVGSLLKFSDVT